MSKEFGGTTTAVVLDDDPDTRFAIGRILGKCGCDVLEAESVEEAVALIDSTDVHFVLSDMRIPGAAGGEELLEVVCEQYSGVKVVLMSCAMDDDRRKMLMNNGAFDCVQKPFFKDKCELLLEKMSEPVRKTA